MKIITFAIERPKAVVAIMLLVTLILLAFIPQIKIDTDPENMLSESEPVRATHNMLKEKYNMHDILVLGIINEEHPEGVFNKSSLTKIHELSEFIYSLEEMEEETTPPTESENEMGKEKIKKYKGVIKRDVMAPSNVDHIEPIGAGTLKFDWLMPTPPANDAEALQVKEKLLSNEMFRNTLVSEDGKAICLYIPISSKDLSYEISTKLQDKVATYEGDEQYHITGLPVAEDTFGIEMFIQMAITAPAAMICIFVLMMLFFRKFKLILSPMIVAMISVICTMGLLIATGNTVHIMSSMIPIFVMPIAVLDSIHILSEFFDKYPKTKKRKQTIEDVMKELFRPMLFTSLTSAAGFASLALTPIPPVQVFGIFVAFGILLAWLLTITFIPAYIMMMKEESLENFGMKEEEGTKQNMLMRFLQGLRNMTGAKPRAILAGSALLFGLAMYGINLIEINDNPVKWFTEAHPIRVADKALNKHFGGTYMAFLSLTPEENNNTNVKELSTQLNKKIEKYLSQIDSSNIFKTATNNSINKSLKSESEEDFFSSLTDDFYEKVDESETDEESEVWEELAAIVELETLSREQIFKQPEVLEYVLRLEEHLLKEGGVGKINSLATLIKKLNKELHEGDEKFHKIPNDFSSVGQCIISYQNSHLPEQLRHFADSDYNGLNLWLQLKSGDNKDMEKTIASVTNFFEKNPPPNGIKHDWYGLTYINVVWQKKMVAGMLNAFLSSFLVVFLMMTFLFRSPKWAFLCMLPLSLTIALIYGAIGFIGKDYDMPVAVLSSLALGLAIDFSIHFLVRAREAMNHAGSWKAASFSMFGEPSRAISRNVIVIAVGFLPLLLSSLTPYKTVGMLLASILLLSGLITLILLPALIQIFEKYLISKK